MMKCTLIVLLLVVGINAQAATARFKIIVIDSMSGTPIQGAKVAGWFHNAAKGWMSSGRTGLEFSYTDSKGCCYLSGSTDNGDVSAGVWSANGYYAIESIPNCVPRGDMQIPFERVSYIGRWLPDDIVVTTRLDRIINPIPLFVKNAFGAYRERNNRHFVIHANNKDLSVLSATNDVPIVRDVTMAYDLCKGAWLAPHGEGKVADIEFTCNETVMGWKRYGGGGGVSVYKKYKTSFTISFPGKGNGIRGDIPEATAGIKVRSAPNDGYEEEIVRWKGWLGEGPREESNCDKQRCYTFRIRVEYDKQGNIKSALYGKIYDDFDLSSLDGVRFLYYLNPTPNDRNLEWDMKNNLCPKPGDIGNPRP